MPSPDLSLLQRLQHLPEEQQRAWLRAWSLALLQGQEPPPLPPRPRQ